MTIGKAVDYFIREYTKAINSSWVEKPISYALYQTWKWVDEREQKKGE